MPKLEIARGLTVLREGTYLTDAGVSTSDGLEFVEVTVNVQDVYDGSRDDVNTGTAGSLTPGASSGRHGEITIRGELKGPGAAYSAALDDLPWYHLLLGCAVSGTVGGGSLTLAPVRPDLSGSFTLGYYTGDGYFKFEGCRGNMRFSGTAAERGFWEFTGFGVLAASYPTAVTLPTITYANQADLPPVFTSGSAVLGAWTPVIRSYEFDLGNATTPRLDGNAATGHAGFAITNRSPSWSFPGEVVGLATYDPFSTSLSGTTSNLAWTHGAATGQTFAFDLDKASVQSPEMADESGLLMWNVGGRAHITTGNDEWSLVGS
jgi:hypothetical protein